MPEAKVMAVVLLDTPSAILIEPIFQLAFIVTVPAAPASVNITVSCGNGKLAAAGAPLFVVAQPVADQLFEPAKFQ